MQNTEGSDKFGAANAAARVHTTSKVETNNGLNEGGMKSLEVYFYNLAAAAVNEKSVLEQLVANNDKLATTNEELVATVKNLPTISRILKGKPPASIKQTDKERGNRPFPPIAKKRGIIQLRHALKL